MARADHPSAPAPPPVPRDEAAIAARVEELRGSVQRVIWAEHEPAEHEPTEDDGEDDLSDYFFDLLERRLEIQALDNRFGVEPLDDHVVSLCRSLGLDLGLASRWRDLPDPPDEPFSDPPDDAAPRALAWRGSG